MVDLVVNFNQVQKRPDLSDKQDNSPICGLSEPLWCLYYNQKATVAYLEHRTIRKCFKFATSVSEDHVQRHHFGTYGQYTYQIRSQPEAASDVVPCAVVQHDVSLNVFL